KNNLPLSFLGEDFLGVIGGLFLDRPLYYNNYAPDYAPDYRPNSESGELYRNFKSLSEITQTSRALEQIIALDTVLDKLNVDIKSFEEGVLTYKTLILTLWAKDRLNLPPTLEPIDTMTFKNFFIALFSKPDSDKTGQIQLNDLITWTSEITGIDESKLAQRFGEVLRNLIKELEEEYSTVDPKNIDPRFIPHFLLRERKKNDDSKG
ncbi:MAG: DUF6178 family protein, partial [Desulfobacula sp.]|uniref:DUF6178 family protein n=1 Tax=Desulfobacula sp. TaxID=2593537 RepID=UPI0025C09BD4